MVRDGASSASNVWLAVHLAAETGVSASVTQHPENNRAVVKLGPLNLFLSAVELGELIDVLTDAQAELSLAVNPPEGE
ncbi:hypothetical protein AB0M43_30785 [Longispora sp. NPDC051575]|uniref:hypothetical protein n=1 Tax=Longispora sp. NPDC051575 TaxID=3154943 RepID=UPI003435DDA0